MISTWIDFSFAAVPVRLEDFIVPTYLVRAAPCQRHSRVVALYE
jgi:hypothetical protein